MTILRVASAVYATEMGVFLPTEHAPVGFFSLFFSKIC